MDPPEFLSTIVPTAGETPAADLAAKLAKVMADKASATGGVRSTDLQAKAVAERNMFLNDQSSHLIAVVCRALEGHHRMVSRENPETVQSTVTMHKFTAVGKPQQKSTEVACSHRHARQ